MKKKPTRKQHYVPQVYLKGFSNCGNMINAYWSDNNGIIKEKCVPIESICRENYLYELKNDSNELIAINYIEKCLSVIEGEFSEYRNILLKKAFNEKYKETKCFFSAEEKDFWTLYIGFQMLRTPNVLNEAKSFSRDYFGESLGGNLSDNIAILQCLPFLKEKELGEQNCFLSFIKPMLEMSIALGVDSKGRIITSDNPVYPFSSDKTIENFEEIVFPISDQLVIFLFGGDLKEKRGKNRLFTLNDGDIDSLIKLIACPDRKMIFSKQPLSDEYRQLIKLARNDKADDDKK